MKMANLIFINKDTQRLNHIVNLWKEKVGLFMMLSLGIVLSCLILICELVFSKQPYKNKDTKILIKRHCSGCDEKQHSSHYCVDCMEYLCYVCYEAHWHWQEIIS